MTTSFRRTPYFLLLIAATILRITILLPNFVMPRRTQRIELPSSSIGTRHTLLVHNYGLKTSPTSRRAYIQSSLHADELPGLLVSHHLLYMLDKAELSGHILEEIIIIPYANPIGLSQHLLGNQLGRFSFQSGINFNRNYADVTKAVALKIEDKLSKTDSFKNVQFIREALNEEIDSLKVLGDEGNLKKILFKIAAQCDIVLDLHCDSNAVMHMYTHSKLWPALSDLATELESECHLLASAAGGNPFDDACSCPWGLLGDQFPSHPIPMACQSATVELRGESDVSDDFALKDAKSIFRFLQRRGYISALAYPSSSSSSSSSPSFSSSSATATTTTSSTTAIATDDIVPITSTNADTLPLSSICKNAKWNEPVEVKNLDLIPVLKNLDLIPVLKNLDLIPVLKREASLLSNVDMVEAEKVGIVVWKIKPGYIATKNEILGEIIDIEDPDCSRCPVVSRTSGVVFSMTRHRLVRPGQVIIKIAGNEQLEWRTGDLLTSR